MSHEAKVGLIMWAVIWWPLWSPTLNLMRARNRRTKRTTPRTQPVSARRSTVRVMQQTGPAWEQDEPFPECFTDDGEDDL